MSRLKTKRRKSMSNRPILLDNACTRSTIDDKHIFIYDIQSDINVIKTEEGTIPFISLGQASIEAQTETRVQRESDDIEYNTMELMTKTEVLRERDDEQSFFQQSFSVRHLLIGSEMMKMILIITNKTDVTVDFIVQELKRQKCQYYRFNTEDIPLNVVVNFNINEQCYELLDKNKGLTISLKDISAVYFRRPKVSELDYIIDIDRQERCYLRNELSTLLEGIYKSLRNVFGLIMYIESEKLRINYTSFSLHKW